MLVKSTLRKNVFTLICSRASRINVFLIRSSTEKELTHRLIGFSAVTDFSKFVHSTSMRANKWKSEFQKQCTVEKKRGKRFTLQQFWHTFFHASKINVDFTLICSYASKINVEKKWFSHEVALMLVKSIARKNDFPLMLVKATVYCQNYSTVAPKYFQRSTVLEIWHTRWH